MKQLDCYLLTKIEKEKNGDIYIIQHNTFNIVSDTILIDKNMVKKFVKLLNQEIKGKKIIQEK